MAVLAIFYHPDIKREHYEILRREVAWETRFPEGGMFHAAAFDEQGGTHVADVWESRQAFDAFVANRLMPVFQKHNMPAPQVQVFDAYNINALPAIEKYILGK
jgi:hypothetical protein